MRIVLTVAGAAALVVPGTTVDQLCGCVADRMVEGRSADDLARMKGDNAAQSQAGQEAGMHCAMAQLNGGAGAAGDTK